MSGAPIPSKAPDGPFFVDTASCQCAIQPTRQIEIHDAQPHEAWRCIGQGSDDVYVGDNGKWFFPVNSVAEGSKDTSEPIFWADNPPNSKAPYVVDDSTNVLRFQPLDPGDDSKLSLVDKACTGENSTKQSAQYYATVSDVQAGRPVSSAALCYPGTQPVILGNASFWNDHGCNLGFFCQHNTVIRLPQWCPPYLACNSGRLAGGTCPAPMGPLEPIVCKEGNYCPKGGATSIVCPVGHYCSKGAYEPTACTVGARCPEGSYYNMTFLPLGFLIALDLVLIACTLGAKFRERLKRKPRSAFRESKSLLRRAVTLVDMEQRRQQYQYLQDDDVGVSPRIVTVQRSDTGFGGAAPDAFDEEEPITAKPRSDLQLFIQSMSRCIGATSFGLSFEFIDLAFLPKKASRPILSEVTGNINRGTLSGVMGASGAGKTTFVNVLMGKTAHTGGITKINGVPGNISKYKKIIGYVPQDDIILPELTVRENILHSARIRLPSNWSNAEVQGHVDILISCLQLAHVKDSLVGSAAAPVISGGQRKRVSIGMELAALPMALFLDEPTSGLDATSASSIMKTLKELSRLGITIVTVIHQPRQEIFESLDNLLLFGAGRMIFQGPESDVQGYFENVGFRFPEHANPADVVMDIIAGQGQLYKRVGETGLPALIEHWKNHQYSLQKHSSVLSVSQQETQALRSSIKMRGAPWWRQTYFCFLRSITQQIRLKSSFFSELGVGALAGFLIGLAQLSAHGINFQGLFHFPYELLSSSLNYSAVPQMALLVGLSIGLTASSPGVKIFGEEKLVYWREAASGHHRLAYNIGKVLSTLPRMAVANLHFTTLFFLLATPRIPFAAAFVANLCYFWCIYGLASCISMLTRREDGPLLAVMTSLIVGVLNGLSPSLAQVRTWHMQWLWRSSPGTWLAELYFDQNVRPLAYLYQVDHAALYQGYRLGHFSRDLYMLFVLGLGYRVLAFVLMVVCNRHRQK